VGWGVALALVRMSNKVLSDDRDWRLEVQMQLSSVGDGRRPLAGATDCGKLPKTRTTGSLVSDRWWVDGSEKASY
jgi:hypothetical protein